MDGAAPLSLTLTRGEAVVVSIAMAIAAAVLAAYLPYRIGWRVVPAAVLIAALAIGGAALFASLRRATASDGSEIAALLAIVPGVFGWALWITWPALLPVGGGPDLTHHLVLVNFIERNWQLVYDPALVPYLGDMIFYTPGSHLLMALAGAWSRTDGLHAAQTVLAITVAIKAGVVFMVARRLLPRAATPFAAMSALLLFVPYAYFAGSFAHDSFWAQVVAELFACVMWWTIVAWDQRPAVDSVVLFGVAGAAAFITWPIWIGPPLVALTAIVAARAGVSIRQKASQLTIALGPVAIVAAIHTVGRLRWLGIVGTSGAVVQPSIATLGWPFVALAAAGVLLLAARRDGRATIALLAATALQAIALFAVARSRGADTPYLALKMMFLAVYPLAVAAALTVAAAWTIAMRAVARDRSRSAEVSRSNNPDDGARGLSRAIPWIVVAVAAVLIGRQVAGQPRPRPIVTESAFLAGRWARANVPPACVDYLVADGYTAYWLHLAVLDNPRNTARVEDPDTFEPAKAFERWIYPNGLPYAIVDDVNGFSKALFSGTDEIARFGPSAVIKRRNAATCEVRP